MQYFIFPNRKKDSTPFSNELQSVVEIPPEGKPSKFGTILEKSPLFNERTELLKKKDKQELNLLATTASISHSSSTSTMNHSEENQTVSNNCCWAALFESSERPINSLDNADEKVEEQEDADQFECCIIL